MWASHNALERLVPRTWAEVGAEKGFSRTLLGLLLRWSVGAGTRCVDAGAHVYGWLGFQVGTWARRQPGTLWACGTVPVQRMPVHHGDVRPVRRSTHLYPYLPQLTAGHKTARTTNRTPYHSHVSTAWDKRLECSTSSCPTTTGAL